MIKTALFIKYGSACICTSKARYTHQNRTSELHKQPILRFINIKHNSEKGQHIAI
jgi:hypothetical protein